MRNFLKLLIPILPFFLLGRAVAYGEQLSPDLNFLFFEKETSLANAVKMFNEENKARLSEMGQLPLSVDELKNALAIGNGFYLRPSKGDVANLCNKCFINDKLYEGASLALCTAESIGRPEDDHQRRFFFIFLTIQVGKITATGGVPDEKSLNQSGRFPVRLTPLP